jgi:hypothetical protein
MLRVRRIHQSALPVCIETLTGPGTVYARGCGTSAGLFNSIALSEGLYLADAINATACARAAYGATLYRDAPARQRIHPRLAALLAAPSPDAENLQMRAAADQTSEFP